MNIVINKNTGLEDSYNTKIGDFIWTQTGYAQVTNKTVFSGDTILYYSNVGQIYGDNRIITNGRKIKASDTKSIDMIFGPHCDKITHDPKIIMDGLMIGDGSLYAKRDIHLNIGKKDMDYFESEVRGLIGRKHPSTHDLGWFVDTNITVDELPYLPVRCVPDRYICGATKDVAASFLRGLFSANGTISNNKVSLRSTCFKLISQVQLMLGYLGIRSYYSYNKPRLIKWENGDYTSKEAWDLCVNQDRNKYYKIIGFLQKYKMVKLTSAVRSIKKSDSKVNFSIERKEPLNIINLASLKVDNKWNTYWCNCLNICGI